jgi:hypothetical protein
MSAPAVERLSEDLEQITIGAALTRGLGRSYGDSSLPPPDNPTVAASPLADRLLAFDEHTGDLRAEAGYSMRDSCIAFFRADGRRRSRPARSSSRWAAWSPRMCTARIIIRTARSAVISRTYACASGPARSSTCSPSVEPELFWATVGGMGLTGHILEVTVRLVRVPSPWIIGFSRRIGDIDEFMVALKQAASEWPYTVGWLDCLSRGPHMGRGVLIAGRWATRDEAPAGFPKAPIKLAVPFVCPSWVMGPLRGPHRQ